MTKRNPNEHHIVLRPGMTPKDITDVMPAKIEIADVLKYTDKSPKFLFPEGCLPERLETIRSLSYAIIEAVKYLDITGVQKKEHLEDNSIVITYDMPTE